MKGLRTLLWACYLGASWTWVIGMLLPILLLRDFGPWGWVAFAVPNVLGAMFMGLVLFKSQSEQIVRRHTVACLAFSRVTMAYQAMVLPWALITFLDWPVAWAFSASAGGYLFVIALVSVRPLVMAAVVTLLSSGLFAWFASTDWAWVGVFCDHAAIQPRLDHNNLIAFAGAAVFGFILCPYLDLTFHHARQQANRVAFIIGFGVVFAAMITLSLAYAGIAVMTQDMGAHVDDFFPVARWLGLLIGAHFITQSAFTVGVHLKQVERFENSSPGRIVLPLVLFLVIGAYMTMHWPDPIEGFGLSASEIVYRILLLAYGTAFPGYVLLMMIPTLRTVRPKARLRVALFAIGISLPMGFVAFVEARSGWMIGVAAVFFIARLIIEILPAERPA